MTTAPPRYDVLVLGAGLAGLGAAQELTRHGLSVAVIEAQCKAGGRANTQHLQMWPSGEPSDQSVEAGAQWIHGKQNPLYDAAEQHNLIGDTQGEEACGRFIRNDGQVLDDELVKRVDFKVGQILEECEEFINSPQDPDVSVLEYLRSRFEAFLQDQDLTDQETADMRQLLDWHVRFQTIDNSCTSLAQLSVNHWGSYSFNGESCQAHINVRQFDKLIEQLVKPIDGKNVHYSHEVVRIDWDALDAVTIHCQNGATFRAQAVIVTFSIGVLHETMDQVFDPRLPDPWRNAIRKTGFGTIDKIFLKYDTPFWASDFKGIQFVWNNNETDDFPGWTRWLTGFDLDTANNVLVGWIGGPGAVEMEQIEDDKIIVEDCVQLLSRFLVKRVPFPSEYYCTRWHSNRFIRGSYCFRGLDEGTKEMPLTDPLPLSTDESRPRILFAGEACHYSYFSTVHGAFLSGLEQARKLLPFVIGNK